MSDLGLQLQRVITIGQHQRNAAFHPESCHKAALPLTSIMNEQLIMHQEFCFRAGENVRKKRGSTKYGDVVILGLGVALLWERQVLKGMIPLSCLSVEQNV